MILLEILPRDAPNSQTFLRLCTANHAKFAQFAQFAPLHHSCTPIPVIRTICAICGHLTPLTLSTLADFITIQGDLSFLPPPKKTESQTWGEGKKQSPRTPPMSGTPKLYPFHPGQTVWKVVNAPARITTGKFRLQFVPLYQRTNYPHNTIIWSLKIL